jgi:hypothetical protein
LSVADLENKWMAFPPLGRGRAHAALRYVNFDGFVVLPGRHPQEAIHAYAQVFRSGIVEAVSTLIGAMAQCSPRLSISILLQALRLMLMRSRSAVLAFRSLS